MYSKLSLLIVIQFLTGFTLLAADFHREVVHDWPKLPASHVLGLCAGIGVDGQNRVFVFHRSGRKWSNTFPKEPTEAPTVSEIDGGSGKLLNSWGANMFIMPHGLTVDHEGSLWLTDVGLHQVFKFTPEGRLLLTLGERRVRGVLRVHPSDGFSRHEDQ